MLSALFERPRNVVTSSVWGSWDDESRTITTAGLRVTEESAAQLLAVYGSASLITDGISTLPVDIDNAERPGWVDEPSAGLDRVSWMGQIVWSILLSGNAYLNVLTSRGRIVALDPIDPARCHVRMVSGRRVVFIDSIAYPTAVHIPGRMLPGALEGMSPVEYCRQSIGLGLAAVQFGANQFDAELNMPGVIEIPGDAQEGTLENLAKQWRRKRRTGGKGLPGVLKGGATWKPTGVTNEQAQFLETRKFTAAEIAGQMFLLDPSDLGIGVDGSSLTYTNTQQRVAERTRKAYMPLIRRIESRLTPLLFGGLYRFDVDSQLRGNTKESYETLAVGISNGFLTIDEVRAILGLPPRPDQTEAPTARDLAEMVQKIYLGVGVVLTADEARDILNSGGADLPAGFNPTSAA